MFFFSYILKSSFWNNKNYFTIFIYKIKEIEVKGATFVKGSTIINKTPADIERFVMAEYPDARNIVVTMDKEGNNSYYEAEFTTLKFKGELKFNPATGVIFERELDYY